MGNMGLTDRAFETFCFAVMQEVKKYYEKPENMAAFEKWQKDRQKNEKESNARGEEATGRYRHKA